MNTQDFTAASPGQLVRNLNGDLAYRPNPLPPTLELTPALFATVYDAAVALAELAGVGRRLVYPQRLVRMFLRREAELSSKIENTYASVRDLILFAESADAGPGDLREVANNLRTLEYAVDALSSRDLTRGFIKEMHAILLQNVRGHDKTPGAFRTVQAHIGSSPKIELAKFVPAPPFAIDDCMADLERYLLHADALVPVIRVAIVHYQFETIHPFADGNGRVGRALLLVQLIKEGVIPAPLLNPSAQLERNRPAYYDGLLGVSQRGRWNEWIEFVATSLATEAREATQRIEKLEDLKKDYVARVVGPQASALLVVLIEELMAEPRITIAGAMKRLEVTFHTARKLIERLVETEVLREITGQKRDRVYLAQGVVDLFSD